MSLMLQKLNNIRSLRAMSREFSIDVLEEMLENSGSSLKKNAQSSTLPCNSSRIPGKINTWLELMIADGITPDELVTQNAGPSKAVKNASRGRQNTGLAIFPARRKPGPARGVCRSRSPVRLRLARRWKVF
jgi:DNA-binding protein H-NS